MDIASKDVILPLIALFSGVVSLFIDPKDGSKRWKVFVLLMVLVLVAGVTIQFNFKDAKAAVAQHYQDLQDQRVMVVGVLQSFGFTQSGAVAATAAVVSKSIDANRLYMDLLAAEPKNAPVNISVRYYPKGVDRNRVIEALQASNFNVVTTKALLPDEQTNAIWVGDSVSLHDAKLVAAILMRAGVGIVKIYQFHDGAGPKSHLIEVGTKRFLDDCPTLQPDDVAGMSEIRTDPLTSTRCE